MAKAEEWRKLFERQRRSGKSIAAWCKQEGINTNRYYYWRQRLAEAGEDEECGRFVRVEQAEAVELFVGEKVRLRIPANFDSMSLKRLLEVVGC